MSLDASDLDKLADDFVKIPAEMVPKLKPVVAKSALNVKKSMQADARKSKHFDQLAPTISYDLEVRTFGGDGTIDAEIGPSGAGAASLAGIAYFGTSKPGGGTIRNPEDAMLDEAANFYEFTFKATEGLL